MDIQTTNKLRDEWLAQALINHQILDESQFQELVVRHSDEEYFLDILTEHDILSISDIILFVENILQIPPVNLDQIEIQSQAIELVPEEVCQKYLFLPFGIEDERILHIASANPFDLEAEKEIETITGKYIKSFFAIKHQIQRKISEYYSPDKYIDSIVDKAQIQRKVTIADEDVVEGRSSVIKLLNIILADAIEKEASDIHIEPKEKSVQVRFRIDGVLRNILEVPKSVHQSLISRIKIISNLNIAETRKPQDGKSKIIVDSRDVDLRISVLPTNFGEKAVIRILDKRRANVAFPTLGIRGDNLRLIEKCFEFKQGIVLVTGPTGSGKSTTLYAALNRIRSTTNNILTIEDPIEYMIEGINQVQVNEKAGITFATALRSFLRQDPDVILVGEIRDRETAQIAVQAALTGHLVLSTLHTNDTFSTVTRLMDMGVDGAKVSDALQAIISQRLVRRLCEHCKEEKHPNENERKIIPILKKMQYPTNFYTARGCTACGFSGYRGRIGIYEILIVSSALKDLIATDAPLSQIKSEAQKSGFQSLYEDAVSLVGEGITDYQEILRVINPDSVGTEQGDNESEIAPGHRAGVAQTDREALQTEAPDNNKQIDILEMPKKILLVEDSRDMRIMIKRLMEKKSSWQLHEAEDGVKAMELVARLRPDAIVLDVMMPNMNGYEFLKWLRNDLSTATIPVLMLTALKDVDEEIKGLELGADDYLTKPFNAKVLFARLKRLFSRDPFRTGESANGQRQPKPEQPELEMASNTQFNFKLV